MNHIHTKSQPETPFYSSSFLIALGIINIFAITLLLSASSFFLGIGLSRWHLPLAVALSLVINVLVARRWLDNLTQKMVNQTNLILIGILLICVLLVIPVFDTSMDGQWYHQESVYQIAHGWNPFRVNFPDDTIRNGSLWFNHYAKGLEIFQACFYLMTGKFESGKATALFLGIGSFFLCVFYLGRLQIFSRRKLICISFLLAASPLVIVQIFTFCNDGQMSSLLLYALITCCLIFQDFKKYLLILLFSVVLCAINIKFTSIAYLCIFIGALLVVLFFKNRSAFRSVFITALVSGIFAVVFIGYNPYVTNYVNNGHPFYPLLGKGKVDIMTAEYPISWRHMNRFHKFILSTLSPTDDMSLLSNPYQEVTLKWPFMITRTDIHNSANPQVKMGGFGPLFSGLLLLTLILILWIGFTNSFRNKRSYLFILLATIAGSIIIIEESWAARYIPQLWFVPLIVAMAAELDSGRGMRIMRNAIYVLVTLNISFSVLSIPWNYLQAVKIRRELNEMKASGKVIPIDFNYYLSNRFRLSERGIPYQEIKIGSRPDSSSSTMMTRSFTKYFIPK